jgi:hypothetical protein
MAFVSCTWAATDVKISALPDGGSGISRSSIVPVVEAGVTKRATVGQITDIPTPAQLSKAKADLVYQTFHADTKAYWIFDATGTATTVADKVSYFSSDVSPHTVVLRDPSLNAVPASGFAPSTYGFGPTMGFNSSLLWDASDNEDFTFAGASDVRFAMVVLVKFTAIENNTIVAKRSDPAYNAEWALTTDNAGKLYVALYDSSSNGAIGRRTPALQAGVWYTIMVFYDGSATAGGISIYLNGVKSDDTNWNAGSYASMKNRGGKVGSYYVDGGGIVTHPGNYTLGALSIVKPSVDLSSYARVWDMAFRGYVGQF